MTATRVILVEDDADDRMLFDEFYRARQDIQLLPSVTNGQQLMEYLGNAVTDEQLPHLIVLDQNMPIMNGKQTLKALSSDPHFSTIPVVVYTTYADSNLIQDCLDLGARTVAIKPLNHQGYQKMMDNFLELIGP